MGTIIFNSVLEQVLCALNKVVIIFHADNASQGKA